jgi:hypothetical protein
MSLTANDLIEEAFAIAGSGAFVELPEEMSDEDRESAIRAHTQHRIDKWLADRQDRLQRIRYVRMAALKRKEAIETEMKRYAVRAAREASLARYCEELATNLLEVERTLSGSGRGEAFRVDLADGARVGIRISVAVSAPDVDALPDEFVREKVIREPDKIELGKRLKAGEVIPGASLVKNEGIDWGR